MRIASILVGLAVSLVAACQREQRERPVAATTTSDGDTARRSFAAYDAGAVPGGPGAGTRYALGRTAAAGDIARIDHDVGAAGMELPAGRGTVAAGAALFATQCAACHGGAGEGIEPVYPALIGRDPRAERFVFATDPTLPHTIGNYWPYAAPLFDYIKRAMPLTAPGSLRDDQVYALTAYLLAANRVIADSGALDAATLRAVRMPYVDRFVPDDRKPDRVAK